MGSIFNSGLKGAYDCGAKRDRTLFCLFVCFTCFFGFIKPKGGEGHPLISTRISCHGVVDMADAVERLACLDCTYTPCSQGRGFISRRRRK